MVHHMVQEKHQDKLKTTIIQFIMLTYFLSVIMKDPVGHNFFTTGVPKFDR